ncbi:MAG TPA: response regulator [Planctomicrobium sp.]|nr:response regulator [Planctomicrobium sp.]
MTLDAIGRPMEILLIEDSLVAARMTTGALARSKIEHRLTWLSDGLEARSFLMQTGKYARAPQPDLILLDLHLPEVDGTTLLRELRQRPELRQVPTIIMTGTLDQAHAAEIESLDIQGCLIKPVNLDQFLELVEKLKGYWKTDMIVRRSES